MFKIFLQKWKEKYVDICIHCKCRFYINKSNYIYIIKNLYHLLLFYKNEANIGITNDKISSAPC